MCGAPNEIQNASKVGLEFARPDWTRRFIRGSAEDAKFEGNREIIIHPAVDAGFGETRRRRDGKAGGCGIQGNLGVPSAGAMGASIRGDPKTLTKAKPEGAGCGATRNHTGRRSRMSIAVGKPKAPAPEAPKDARFGATRDSIRRQSRKMKKPGQPGESSAGATGERAAG
jgi:hypothetical protein